MMNRGRAKRVAGWAAVAVAAVTGAVGVEAAALPRAQLDLFAASPANPATLDAATEAGVRAAIAAVGPARAEAMVAPGFGEAAASSLPGRVLRVVEVEALAADRVRVRVASRDLQAAHAVADNVGTALAAQGLRERLRLRSETTGGRAVLLAHLLLTLAAVGAAVRALALVFARPRTPAEA